ncbi:phosphatidylserine decarboxylase proenzyme [Dissulfurispira thermophila]|uniref:Phosphatidylserine decarboxylase proenzyme n=2 Tax=root TaxID=1 RepID=A0A7G1H0S7_9BACT|nr:phosphatidylserine decarboxylase family protein [Dissulfurispira thermophila]BCB95879.1 phosphatidylserine decarboxylase proenzyme [Dissulfurispira thermophila]
MLKLAPEGYPFIIFFSVLTIISFFLSSGIWIALLPFILTLFMLYFFRDPERIIPEGENIFVSPADGKVILIKNVYEEQYLKSNAIMVSIFMSPLNVHVNRSPCDGIVESVIHTKGKFLSAFKHEASLQNENIIMLLNTRYGKVLVRQVAGFVARRAVCRVKIGDALKKGERYGIIKFSSRLDVYLPKDVNIKVKLGDKVKAGETIIAII